MPPEELRELLGPETDSWLSAGGLHCVRAGEQVQVWHGGELVGFTEPSEEFPTMRTYRVVLAQRPMGHPWSVAYPAGFLPPDPLWSQYTERLRWLPADHPSRPEEGLDRAAFHALVEACGGVTTNGDRGKAARGAGRAGD
ncbi:hypothetical protein [Streptomyces sp. NPDC018045]|uniref:hypothetical protein n=1 Tax=Streptomyces sp. NPDC018045 TaxID=3365037 RepID=UPI0037AA5E82